MRLAKHDLSAYHRSMTVVSPDARVLPGVLPCSPHAQLSLLDVAARGASRRPRCCSTTSLRVTGCARRSAASPTSLDSCSSPCCTRLSAIVHLQSRCQVRARVRCVPWRRRRFHSRCGRVRPCAGAALPALARALQLLPTPSHAHRGTQCKLDGDIAHRRSHVRDRRKAEGVGRVGWMRAEPPANT